MWMLILGRPLFLVAPFIISSCNNFWKSRGVPVCINARLKGDSSMAEGSGSQPSVPGTLELKFVNSAIKNLPLDTTKENYVRSVQGNYKC